MEKRADYFIEQAIFGNFIMVFLLYYLHVLPNMVCNGFYLLILLYYGLCTVRYCGFFDQRVFVLVVLAVVFGALTGLNTGNFNPSLYLKTCVTILLGYRMAKVGVSRLIAYLVFWGVTLCFIPTLFANFSDQENLNTFFQGLSRNYFSVFSITGAVLVYTTYRQETDQVPILPAVVTLGIAFLSAGRSGEIAALLLLFGIIYLRMRKNGNKTYRIGLAAAVICMLLVIILVMQTGIYKVLFGRFFEQGLKSPGRSVLWGYYFEQMLESAKNLFFGVDITDFWLAQHYEYNLHNTFLQMHYTFGLFFSVGVFFYLANAAVRMWKSEDQLRVLLLAVFILRAFLDQMGFSFFTEFMIYYFVFYTPETKSALSKPVSSS